MSTTTTLKINYQAAQSLTVTNLNSLASSATAGWQSAAIDNTSNLYEEYLVQVVIDFANTAPANDKTLYVFAGGLVDTGGSAYTDPLSGSEGTLTLTSISTTQQNLRLIGTLAYETADMVAESQPFAVSPAFGGIIPPKFALAIINFTGAAIAGSGNSVKYIGVYRTAIT